MEVEEGHSGTTSTSTNDRDSNNNSNMVVEAVVEVVMEAAVAAVVEAVVRGSKDLAKGTTGTVGQATNRAMVIKSSVVMVGVILMTPIALTSLEVAVVIGNQTGRCATTTTSNNTTNTRTNSLGIHATPPSTMGTDRYTR